MDDYPEFDEPPATWWEPLVYVLIALSPIVLVGLLLLIGGVGS